MLECYNTAAMVEWQLPRTGYSSTWRCLFGINGSRIAIVAAHTDVLLSRKERASERPISKLIVREP